MRYVRVIPSREPYIKYFREPFLPRRRPLLSRNTPDFPQKRHLNWRTLSSLQAWEWSFWKNWRGLILQRHRRKLCWSAKLHSEDCYSHTILPVELFHWILNKITIEKIRMLPQIWIFRNCKPKIWAAVVLGKIKRIETYLDPTARGRVNRVLCDRVGLQRVGVTLVFNLHHCRDSILVQEDILFVIIHCHFTRKISRQIQDCAMVFWRLFRGRFLLRGAKFKSLYDL